MRLAISSIAWDVEEDQAVAALLKQYEVDAIDIAPGKYFPEPGKAKDLEVLAVRAWWAEQGIEITGMQALLFGTKGMNVFGPPASQQLMLEHLGAVCRIGRVLGATRLVFGSPKNRDRSGLSDSQAMEIAAEFFQHLGDIAMAEGVTVCLEPNPSCYGANFMTTSSETARVVKAIDHPAIRMQLDTGAMTINEEDIGAVVEECAGFLGHIHASEPNLLPLGDGGTNHDMVFTALSRYLPDSLVCIEMVTSRDEAHLNSIERALTVASRSYRPSHAGFPK